MTPADIHAVLADLGGATATGPNGIEWAGFRFEPGGGIAGHSQEWWITAPEEPDWPHRGPFRTRIELRTALRRIIIAYIKWGDALLQLEEL